MRARIRIGVDEVPLPPSDTPDPISVGELRLVASVRGAVQTTLTPVYRDAFTGGAGLGTIWFVRDARGTVTEMHSGSARVWDVTFTRQP